MIKIYNFEKDFGRNCVKKMEFYIIFKVILPRYYISASLERFAIIFWYLE